MQIGMDMLPITTSTSDELFIHINIDDFKRPCNFKIGGFYRFLRSLAAARASRVNNDEMAGDRLRQNCEQELV